VVFKHVISFFSGWEVDAAGSFANPVEEELRRFAADPPLAADFKVSGG